MHNIIFLKSQLQSRHNYTEKLSDLQVMEALSYYYIREKYYRSQLNLDL